MGFFNLKQLVREELVKHATYFHGSRSLIPFKNFDNSMEGTGIVSTGKKYGGFFFTSSHENAEYYTEWFVCRVQIGGIIPAPNHEKQPPIVMKQAGIDKRIYMIEDYLDGAVHSNIVVVPSSLTKNIKITGWEFVGDEESYFESLEQMFALGGEQYDIENFFNMTGGGLDYALKIPIFKKFFNSKQ